MSRTSGRWRDRTGPAFLPVRVVGSSVAAVGRSGPAGKRVGVIEVVVQGGRRIRLRGDVDVALLVKTIAVLENLPLPEESGASC